MKPNVIGNICIIAYLLFVGALLVIGTFPRPDTGYHCVSTYELED